MWVEGRLDHSTYLWHLGLHCFFPIPRPAPFGEIINCGKFNEGREDKGIAHRDEPVHGSRVSHFRQRVSSADAESGHGEHCGHTWWCRKLGQFYSPHLLFSFYSSRLSHKNRARIKVLKADCEAESQKKTFRNIHCTHFPALYSHSTWNLLTLCKISEFIWFLSFFQTYQTRSVLAPIRGLAKRKPVTGLQSWSKACRSEWQSSRSSSLGKSEPSSRCIDLWKTAEMSN